MALYKITLALLCLMAMSCLVSCLDADDDERFEAFKQRYRKHYRNDNEHQYRKNIFKENMAKVRELNEQDPNAEYSVTPFSDLSYDEFEAVYLMRDADINEAPQEPEEGARLARSMATRNSGPAPANFDWRSQKAITPVQDQGSCGSCWAFAVAEDIESHRFLAGKKMVRLSPQQLVDCDTSNWGCGGGWPGTAYNHIIKVGGLQANRTYPYTSGRTNNEGSCKFNPDQVRATIKSWTFVSKTGSINEEKMRDDLWTYGPLMVCISATNWGYYRGGIFSLAGGPALDHCVQLTGYGVSETGIPYWTIRNQWGKNWGENGYMRLRRGVNQSLIAAYAIRAVV